MPTFAWHVHHHVLFDPLIEPVLQAEMAYRETSASKNEENMTEDRPTISLNLRLPRQLHDILTRVAKQNHRSLQGELLERLERSLLPAPKVDSGGNPRVALEGKIPP